AARTLPPQREPPISCSPTSSPAVSNSERCRVRDSDTSYRSPHRADATPQQLRQLGPLPVVQKVPDLDRCAARSKYQPAGIPSMAGRQQGDLGPVGLQRPAVFTVAASLPDLDEIAPYVHNVPFVRSVGADIERPAQCPDRCPSVDE